MRFLINLTLSVLMACTMGSTQISAYAEGTCPSYWEVTDPSIHSFDYTKYQGEWYHAATTEPTEPKFCKCDRLTWSLDAGSNKKNFTNLLDTTCTFPVPINGAPANVPLPLLFYQTGKTSTNPKEPTNQLEGALSAGFPLGGQYIVYVDTMFPTPVGYGQKRPNQYHYQHAIVFSCGLNYTTYPNGPAAPAVVYPYFNSVQFLTREPFPSQATLTRLYAKARSLGLRFNQADIDIKNVDGKCTYPPSRLETVTVKGMDATEADTFEIDTTQVEVNAASNTLPVVGVIMSLIAAAMQL